MKRDRQYHGLCVGGPRAGQLHTAQMQTIQCEERPPLRTALEMSLSDPPRCRDPKCPSARGPVHHHGWPDKVEVTTHTYTFTPIGPFALWVHESLTSHEALHALAQAYEEKHRVR